MAGQRGKRRAAAEASLSAARASFAQARRAVLVEAALAFVRAVHDRERLDIERTEANPLLRRVGRTPPGGRDGDGPGPGLGPSRSFASRASRSLGRGFLWGRSGTIGPSGGRCRSRTGGAHRRITAPAGGSGARRHPEPCSGGTGRPRSGEVPCGGGRSTSSPGPCESTPQLDPGPSSRAGGGRRHRGSRRFPTPAAFRPQPGPHRRRGSGVGGGPRRPGRPGARRASGSCHGPQPMDGRLGSPALGSTARGDPAGRGSRASRAFFRGRKGRRRRAPRLSPGAGGGTPPSDRGRSRNLGELHGSCGGRWNPSSGAGMDGTTGA